MRLLWTLILAPIAFITFRLSPDTIARHALYGELSALGYSKSAFPRSFIDEVAGQNLTMAMLFANRKSTFARMNELQNGTHTAALQIHSLMSPDIINASLASTAIHLHELMLKHGVRPTRPPR